MRFSRRTLAELARALANVQAKEEIRILAYEFKLEDKLSGSTLKELAGRLVRLVEQLTPVKKLKKSLYVSSNMSLSIHLLTRKVPWCIP